MEFYRIKQTGENEFIPQRANGIFSLVLGLWDGIQLTEREHMLWYTKELQVSECQVDSLEKAKNVIKTHRERAKLDKKYPIYHKV
jgi:hypothetical protein